MTLPVARCDIASVACALARNSAFGEQFAMSLRVSRPSLWILSHKGVKRVLSTLRGGNAIPDSYSITDLARAGIGRLPHESQRERDMLRIGRDGPRSRRCGRSVHVRRQRSDGLRRVQRTAAQTQCSRSVVIRLRDAEQASIRFWQSLVSGWKGAGRERMRWR